MSSSPYSSSSSTSHFTVFEPPPPRDSSSSGNSTWTSTFLPPFASSSSSSSLSSARPAKPPRLPRTISDMDISSESDEDTRQEEGDLVEEEEEEPKEEEEEEGRVEPLLAAKLASGLLGSVLFTKGQIPTPVQQLAKQASSTSRSSTPTPLPKRPSYLPPRPQPSTLLLPLLESFNTSLQRTFTTLAALSSIPPPPSPAPTTTTSLTSPPIPTSSSPTRGPTLMFLHGPSLLLPKALFGVQLPPLLDDDDANANESVEARRERVQRWDTMERAVLRGLVMLRSRSSSGGDGLAPSKTHLLLLAPRSFTCPSGLWLPRATLSPRLSSLLFTPPPPPPPPPSSSRPQPSRMKKKKGLEVEFVRVRFDGGRVGGNGVVVEDGHGREDEGGDEEGELIWFVWEGGTVEGWREK